MVSRALHAPLGGPRGGHTLAAMIVFCLAQGGLAAQALAADPALMAEGLRVYKTKAACGGCHGWTGRGGLYHDDPGFVPGPSLVETTLDRAAMVELVACGTPGGHMPRYLAAAWSERHPCYGKVADDVPQALPPAPYTLLQVGEIEAVVTYVQEAYQGDGMSLEDCEQYYDPRSPACDQFR